MVALLLWICFGVLSGWIGYLVTRSHEPRSKVPYLVLGTIGAILGGFVTRNIGVPSDGLVINPTSLLTALLTSMLCVVVISCFGKTSHD